MDLCPSSAFDEHHLRPSVHYSTRAGSPHFNSTAVPRCPFPPETQKVPCRSSGLTPHNPGWGLWGFPETQTSNLLAQSGRLEWGAQQSKSWQLDPIRINFSMSRKYDITEYGRSIPVEGICNRIWEMVCRESINREPHNHAVTLSCPRMDTLTLVDTHGPSPWDLRGAGRFSKGYT